MLVLVILSQDFAFLVEKLILTSHPTKKKNLYKKTKLIRGDIKVLVLPLATRADPTGRPLSDDNYRFLGIKSFITDIMVGDDE